MPTIHPTDLRIGGLYRLLGGWAFHTTFFDHETPNGTAWSPPYVAPTSDSLATILDVGITEIRYHDSPTDRVFFAQSFYVKILFGDTGEVGYLYRMNSPGRTIWELPFEEILEQVA